MKSNNKERFKAILNADVCEESEGEEEFKLFHYF